MVSLNRDKGFRPAVPIGMATVCSLLEEGGHTVCTVDLCFSPDFYPLTEALEKFQPEVIGFSLRNLDQQSFLEPAFSLPFARRALDRCRLLCPGAILLLGGPTFTLIPEEAMAFLGADIGVAGPAETVLLPLLEDLARGETPRPLPGVYFRSGNKCDTPRLKPCFQAQKPLLPARQGFSSQYFDSRFKGPTPLEITADTVLSKRGCPLPCIYCVNALIDGTLFDPRHPSHVVDEIEQIIALGQAQRFEFADGAFNVPLHHALEVCREMQRRKIRFPWNAMFNPGFATPELLDLMAETGCDLLELGTESGSDAILHNLKKTYRKNDILRTHSWLDERGITAEHCLFVGSPGETRETMAQSLDLMDALAPRGSVHRIFITLGYRIFSGTELHRLAIERGLLSPADRLAVARFFIEPGIVDDTSILDELQRSVQEHDNWYLWWGLPRIALSQRVADCRSQWNEMARLYGKSLDATKRHRIASIP